MKFRPCIDIHDGKVKQIVGSTLGQGGMVENFISDQTPAWFAEKFRNDGLTGGHVIMLGAGNEKAAIEALSAWPNGMQVGGGITPRNANTFLDAGASHVIVTSYVFYEGSLDQGRLEEISDVVGKLRLVLDLSCAKRDGKYYVKTDRWSKWTDFEMNPKNVRLLSDYCDELLVHAVDVEGKKEGIDSDLVQLLATLTTLPITYAGGIRSLDDVTKIGDLGNCKIDYTIGSALDIYGGNLCYDELVNLQNEKKEG